jgi:hypothetical protein
MLRCNIVSLSDGPVCKTCGCANPNFFRGRTDCRTYYLGEHEPFVERATGWEMALVWGGAIVGAVLFWYGVFKLFVWAITLPVVYESYSTGACVRVDDPEGVYNCENMPTKFYHEWTE